MGQGMGREEGQDREGKKAAKQEESKCSGRTRPRLRQPLLGRA